LPPAPRWDVVDFGYGDFEKYGLVLVNLAEEREYCEKLMLVRHNQLTLAHTHKQKKEDIISRFGTLAIRVWDNAELATGSPMAVNKCGIPQHVRSGDIVYINSGERVTLPQGMYHEFWAVGEYCVVGEVSTANDDKTDNYFASKDVSRFPPIEEDVPPLARLVWEEAV
jgi:hypothetical protein